MPIKPEEVQKRFLAFAETECQGNSPLYYDLSIRIAQAGELLAMASHSRAGQPVANLFLASVHYLVLQDAGSEPGKYYPSVTGRTTAEIPFHIFKQFCLNHEREIRTLLSTQIVQSNVISRCSYLMPVFSRLIARENRPVTLIDIGTSAGLTLNFDRYEYWYNGKKCWGNSRVVIRGTVRDSAIPDIPEIGQPITKIGIDQHVIDPADPREALWLKALVWPDQLDRFRTMEEALKRMDPREISFVKGDLLRDFEGIASRVPPRQNLMVYATHVLYQLSTLDRGRFHDMLDRIGQQRDYYFLSVEGIKPLVERYGSTGTVVELTHYKDGKKTCSCLAETNGHGNWITWKDGLALSKEPETQSRN